MKDADRGLLEYIILEHYNKYGLVDYDLEAIEVEEEDGNIKIKYDYDEYLVAWGRGIIDMSQDELKAIAEEYYSGTITKKVLKE